jgi:hypothetical protein
MESMGEVLTSERAACLFVRGQHVRDAAYQLIHNVRVKLAKSPTENGFMFKMRRAEKGCSGGGNSQCWKAENSGNAIRLNSGGG